jgi:hypothetical protein
MKNVKMQCVDLFDDNENPIHCPLCGAKIAAGCSEENASEWIVGKCEHLLFTAIDEIGFDYRSDRFDRAVEAALSKKTEEEREEIENDVEELAALVEIPNAFMFQSIMGHPAEQTSYVGFAPLEVD